MRTLLGFECKKLLQKKFAVITVLILLVCIFALSWLFIAENEHFNTDGSRITGIAAIQANKAMQAIPAGKLSNVEMKAALEQYQKTASVSSNYDSVTGYLHDEVYIKEILPYDHVLSLLRMNYSPAGNFDYNILSSVTVEMIDQFYEMRHAKIAEIVNMEYSYGNYSEAEKAYILQKDDAIHKPFNYAYADGWKDFLRRGFLTVFLLVGLSVCMIIAPVFAYEYQTGADAVVLSTRFGRKQLIHAKILAGFLVTSGIYFAVAAWYTIIFFAAYGIDGWNASFQIISFTSFYNFNNLQVFLIGLILNYLIILTVMAVTMLLSSMCRTSFAAVTISAIWIIVPLFIPSSKSSKAFNYIINLFPAKSLDTYTVFSVYDVYSLGETVVSLPAVITFVSVIVLIVALPATRRGFRNHQLS